MPEEMESSSAVLENPEVIDEQVISEVPKRNEIDEDPTQESLKKISEGYDYILQTLKSKSPDEIRTIAQTIVDQSNFPSEDSDKYISFFSTHLTNIQKQLNEESLNEGRKILQERLDKDLQDKKDFLDYKK